MREAKQQLQQAGAVLRVFGGVAGKQRNGQIALGLEPTNFTGIERVTALAILERGGGFCENVVKIVLETNSMFDEKRRNRRSTCISAAQTNLSSFLNENGHTHLPMMPSD